MRLGARLSILVLLAALTVLVIQIADLWEQREQRKARIGDQALQLARLAAAQQNQFIEGARYLLTAIAQLPEVQQREGVRCSAQMAEFVKQFPPITGLGVVRPDGVQFCGSSGPQTGISIADRPYFQKAVQTSSLAISGFIIGRRTGAPTLNFAYPALGPDNEVHAVIVVAFGLDRLSEALFGTPLPPGASMSLLDRDGILLARTPPAPERIGTRSGEPTFIGAMRANREGTVEGIGVDGVARLYGFAPLLASADLFAVVGLPWQEAAREASTLFWRSMALTGVAFLAAVAVALLGAQLWIRRPITAIQAAVGRMTEGDLAARAAVERSASPELRELAGSFNAMVGSLETRQRAVQASEARFRAVVETAADGIITISERGVIDFLNPEALRLFGYAREDLIGRNVSVLMPEPDRGRHDSYIARYLRTGEARIIGIGREVTGRRSDGSTFPMFLSIGEFTLDRGRFFTGIVRDITERKRSEERQQLLTAEVDHRAKNLLAAFQSMVLLSKPHARSVESYAQTLVGRLRAMSRAHDLLARDDWEGARLLGLIRAEFSVYVPARGDALAFSGVNPLLEPRVAQTLGSVLHELTTNAAKYGALSRPGGRIRIASSLEPGPGGTRLVLEWAETDGPEVAPPARRGFGSTIIERAIAYDLDGSAALDFARDGLRCRLEIPLGPAPAPVRTAAPADDRPKEPV